MNFAKDREIFGTLYPVSAGRAEYVIEPPDGISHEHPDRSPDSIGNFASDDELSNGKMGVVLKRAPPDRLSMPWEAPIVKATLLDDRRRLVMPPELPAKSAVTVQQIDADTWIVKRHRPHREFVMVAIPVIQELPRDPEWEAVEARLTAHSNLKVAPFED